MNQVVLGLAIWYNDTNDKSLSLSKILRGLNLSIGERGISKSSAKFF
jgi:hypothetical protein